MKLKALPFVLTFATLPALADGPIDGDIYGKINLSLDNVDSEAGGVTVEDEWQLNSNASRFGLKGESKLTDTLSAIYKIEWEVTIDSDDANMKSRNRYIGLTGNFGTLLGGKHDTPVKLAQDDIDLFNDLPGDIKNTFEGENRINDIVMYTTPKLGAFSATLAFAPSEGEFTGDNKAGEPGDDGLADGISLAADLTLDNLYLALGMDRDIDGQDLERLVAQYKLGGWQFGAMLQSNETNSGSLDESGMFFSAAYKFGDNTVKAQIGSQEDDVDDDEEETVSLGFDQKLGKNTKWFVYFTRNTDTDGATNVEDEDTIFGAGLEHKF